MMGSMNKKMIVVYCLILLVFVVGCTPKQPENPQDVAAVTRFVRSGSLGLDMRFVQNFPPNQIYDTTNLPVLLELRNLGTFDLAGNKCFIQLSGFDQSIIRGMNVRQLCGELPGKSVYSLEGGFGTIDFNSGNMILPADVDMYKPNIVATVCYEYQTIASPQVCVDPQFYDLVATQKACQVRDFGVSGGQGAPVAVTYVNVDMMSNKAVFAIDIANVGGGRVVSPRAGIDRCPVGLKYDEFDQVRFRVELSGGRLVQCSPKDFMVRLVNNKGKIVCTFDIGNTQAFETPLRVELDYNYVQTVSKTVEIVRTPG